MTAPRPTGSIDIWNFVDNVTGTTVRKWLRDSWARRKIVALQQAVSSIVVPTRTSQLTNDSGFLTSVPVTSVNNKTGAVSLTASDVGALPSSTAIPSATSDLTNDSGFITAVSVPSASSTAPAMDGTASAGSSTAWARGDHRHPTDTSRQAALSSTQLAAVNSGVTAAKVQEWDAIEVPTKTSELTNDSGFITSAPVASVNGKTGVVNLSASDVGAQDALTVAQLAAVNSGITADDLAVNNASVLCTVTPIVPTLLTGAHYASYGNCYYYKIGHKIHIHIGVSELTSNTANDLWEMPAGYRPYTMVSMVGTGGNISQYGRVRIKESGMVSVSANSTYACVDLEYDAFQ